MLVSKSAEPRLYGEKKRPAPGEVLVAQPDRFPVRIQAKPPRVAWRTLRAAGLKASRPILRLT